MIEIKLSFSADGKFCLTDKLIRTKHLSSQLEGIMLIEFRIIKLYYLRLLN